MSLFWAQVQQRDAELSEAHTDLGESAPDPGKTQLSTGGGLALELGAAGFHDAEEIGRGGFGVVYRCTQVDLGREVAVKVLTYDLHANRERFLREQQAMGQLTGHPNIVPVLQVGETPSGFPFLVMPLCSRGCLHRQIVQTGAMPLDEVLRLGVKIAGALESAHRLGIVHRDVKPANILLTDYNEPALCDFGIARTEGAFKTATGIFIGSPAYSAPEVLIGDSPSVSSDMYSLGATLFAALTGHAAFERLDGEHVVAQFLRIGNESTPDVRPHTIPSAVAAIIERAMARDPGERPSMLEFGEQLQQVQLSRGLGVDEMSLHGEAASRGTTRSGISIRPGSPTRPSSVTRPSTGPRTITPMPMRALDGSARGVLDTVVGRSGELAELRKLVEESRLVTLAGIGGIGKTTLATHAARELADEFPDGVWMVDLADLRDGALLVDVVAAAVGLHDQAGRSLIEALVAVLAGQRTLIVLDNCEHLIDDVARLVDTLLYNCQQVHILATSREILDIGGECVLPLSPLPVPDTDDNPTPEDLSAFAGVALFIQRARTAVPGFTLTEQNAAAVARICSGLEGLPLAIELAAARLRAMSAAQIADGLSDRYSLLSRGRRGAPTRQQTLSGCIDWSYWLCTQTEQRLWAQVSIFAGSFDLPAAQHLSAETLTAGQCLDVLCALVDKSILMRTEQHGEIRFRLLETVRDYGKAHLSATEQQDLPVRHAEYYRQLTGRAAAEWFGPDQVEWLQRITSEMPNLREALKFSLSADPATALAIVTALRPTWTTRGMLCEGQRWLDLALAAASQEPSLERIAALCASADIANQQGDLPSAFARLSEARQHLAVVGDPAAAGMIDFFEGFTAMLSGDPDRARACLLNALDTTDTYYAQVSSMTVMGGLDLLAGDHRQAMSWFEKALALTEESDESMARSRLLLAAGVGCWQTGDLERAEQMLRECLRLAQRIDDRWTVANCLEGLAWVAESQGDARQAVVLMAAVSAISHAIGATALPFTHLGGFHDECQEKTRKQLSAAEYEAAWSEGSAWTFGDEESLASGS